MNYEIEKKSISLLIFSYSCFLLSCLFPISDDYTRKTHAESELEAQRRKENEKIMYSELELDILSEKKEILDAWSCVCAFVFNESPVDISHFLILFVFPSFSNGARKVKWRKFK